MRSKFIIFIAIVIAVLTSVCMLGDDSDGMGVSGSLQYDGEKYGPLTLEAGTYYFEVDYSIYLEYAPGMTKQINNYGAVTLSEQYDCFMTLDYWDNPSSILYTYYAVKEYDVANDYWGSFEMSATKFPVVAGWMDYYIRPVDENYSYNSYKINIGNEYIYLNSGVGHVYIPFDCDVAYISTDNSWDYMDYDVYFSYEIVKDSYEYTSNLYKSHEEYNKIHLDVGTYTFEFSRDGRLDYSESSSISFEFATAEEKNITVTEAGFYYFNPNNLYVHDYDALVPIYYNMSPAPSSDSIQTDVEHDDISSSTVYRWYKGEFNLSSGDHNLYARNSYNYNWCFIKGSTEEIDFVNDIIRANVVSVDHNYPYSLGTSFALDSAATIVMYSLVKEYLIEDIEYRVDNNDSDVVPELFYGGEDYEAVYVGANDEVKIGATYDSKKHVLFLVSFDEMIMLPCGEYINVSTVAAKEYEIIAIPLVTNDISCFEVEYQLYTEGVPKSDSLAPLFAAVSIGLCAVFFGLLFISGRKPKWKD